MPRTDNGKEYCNAPFKALLQRFGILHQTTAPYTTEQNGVAERMNRTLVERSRCMLFDSQLCKKIWAEAVMTAAYIINRSPCRMIDGKSPEEAWTGRKPNLQRLRVYGYKCQVHVPKQKRHKFDSKSEECIFLGYSSESEAYRLYNPITRKILISRDVIFFENMPLLGQVNIKTNNLTNYFDMLPEAIVPADSVGDVNDDNLIASTLTSTDNTKSTRVTDSSNDSSNTKDFIPPSKDVLPTSEIRKSSRTPKPQKMDDYHTYNVKSIVLDDPKTLDEAMNRADSNLWKEAVESEYQSLIENKTWELVNIPPDKKPIDCKWVFKIKRDSNGKIVRYKAQLVIKGYAQKKGINFEETYSPVVRYSSIRFRWLWQ